MSCRGQAGLTLVELMIAVVISGLVISAALATGFSMMNGYRDHRAMVLVERSARVSLDIMADAIRNSNPGVPRGRFEDLVDCGGEVAGLDVINHTDGPDELKVIYASGGIFTAIYQANGWGASDTTFTVLDAEEVAGQDFFADDYVLVTDLDAPETETAAITRVTDVTAAGGLYTITTALPPDCTPSSWPTDGYKSGSLVIRARYAHFYIEDDASVGGIPTLMMDPDAGGPELPEPIAEGIEDMQIAIGVDDSDDGLSEVGVNPDDDEWYYNVDGDPAPSPALVPRALRITLVARSTREQSELDSYARPAAEDHAADGVKDPFRRRVLSTTVEIRNLAGSR